MVLAERKTGHVRWAATVRSGATIAEDILHRGEKVGPRTGPEKRTHGEKEDYVLRRILVAWREDGLLRLPLCIEAERDRRGEPDFRLLWPDGSVVGLEVTEAGEESHQRALTALERRPGVLHLPEEESPEASTSRTIDELARALERKRDCLAKGAYGSVDSCELAIYDNTAWGGFLAKRELVEGLRQSNRAGPGGFAKVHVVFESDVFLDVFGELRTVSLLRRYESDYVGWINDQADQLRVVPIERIDGAHVAEEIEDLAKSERSKLASHLRNLLLHLLKWRYQPAKRTRSWALSIHLARVESHEVLTENPSLEAVVDELTEREYRKARFEAARQTKLSLESFPTLSPFTRRELGDPDFPPDVIRLAQAPTRSSRRVKTTTKTKRVSSRSRK